MKLAKKKYEKILISKTFDEWIKQTHQMKELEYMKVNEFRKYLNKKRIFKVLQSYFYKKTRIFEYLLKKRKRIYSKCFDALEKNAFLKLEEKKIRFSALIHIFHSWKMITKMNLLRK